MDTNIMFRPYRTHGWIAPVALCMALLCAVLGGYLLEIMLAGAWLFLFTEILAMWVTKTLYDSANIVIHISPKGLQVFGDHDNRYVFRPWDELSYAYDTNNYKGHHFLVLSPERLSAKEAKMLANNSAIRSKICIDLCVILYIDESPAAQAAKEAICRYAKSPTAD